ncbi:MAG: MFS transporter [Planctomycetota bacterium]|nr:MFS transporter [Planctomycetota bacterium]
MSSSPPTTPSGKSPGGPSAHDPYAALRIDVYRRWAVGSLFWTLGQQMTAVAVSWQVYLLTNSKTALGLAGLAQALPLIFLAIPAGQLADQFNRKRIVLAMVGAISLISMILAVISYQGLALPDHGLLQSANAGLESIARTLGERDSHFDAPIVPLLFLLLLLAATAQTFSTPARQSLLPEIIPIEHFSNAVTWQSSVYQLSSTVGPALGGLLLWLLEGKPYALSVVYGLDALFAMVLLFSLAGVAYAPAKRSGEPISLKTLGAGVHFVFSRKIILATITLDLFAVLLGGAVALLPVFAKDILHVGAMGLGILRAAPSVGAVVMAMVLAHRPPLRHAGSALLWAVAGFGVATIVFGLSTNFWISLVALALTGAFDNISVVVRHTLVQVLTPDAMRGRVSAVNSVFIGSSNELGALESGLTAASFGPVWSVVGGGIGTVAVVLVVAAIWPEIRRLGSLHDAHRHAEG